MADINWENPPIFDDYPDDAAHVVQEPLIHLQLEQEQEQVQIIHSPDVVQEQEQEQVQIIHSPDVVQEQEQVQMIHSPDVVQEQEDHLLQVQMIHSPDVVQEQEDHLSQVQMIHSPDVVQEQEDHLLQVSAALSKEALKASKLLFGIDFTISNEWTGKVSFNNRSLHGIGDAPNPYEKAMSIIGTTLAPFDEDNLITCFGFGDEITHDQEVFSFHSDHSPCHGLEETLSCYRKIAQNAKLAGPTSYAPVIEAAINTVEKSGGRYHVLLIISDGQVTRSSNTSDKDLSPQEEETLKSIVNARSYPLSIVLVRVGDGPWEDMKNFELRARECPNFQMVNFTEIMSTNATSAEKEIAFARAALMEIPFQYKAAVELGILGRVTGRAEEIIPRPPPVPPTCETSNLLVCPICATNPRDWALGCGHVTCRDCGARSPRCPMCRKDITGSHMLYL